MRLTCKYVKSVVAATYVGATAAVTYVKAIISTAHTGISEAISAILFDSAAASESGYLCFQDYGDPDMFATGDYVATSYQVF